MSEHAARRPQDAEPGETTDGAPLDTDTAGTPEESSAAQAAEHRRRVDRIFGAVLSDVTEDERTDERPDGGTHDDWLRSNVPPHHG